MRRIGMMLAVGMLLVGCGTTADGTAAEQQPEAAADPEVRADVDPVEFDDDSDLLTLYRDSEPPHGDVVTKIAAATHADAFTIRIDTDDRAVATDVCDHARQLFLIGGKTALVTVYPDGDLQALAMNVGDLRPECRPIDD